MIRTVDLHTHSSASDGQYDPAELVEMAQKNGVEVLAVTDHDTIDGVEEAVLAGERVGIRVLQGVELSAGDYVNLHILGYGFSTGKLERFLAERKKSREARKYRIADFLREKGICIDLAEVERQAGGGSVGRPHFALAMVEQGFVSTRKEAFDRYLDTAEFHAFDKSRLSAETCIRELKDAGGKVSLAHPYQILLGKETLDHLVRRLTDLGLDAIECCYPRHTPEQTAYYRKLAGKYRLHITGGSDFHGERHKPDIQLSRWRLDVDWLLDA